MNCLCFIFISLFIWSRPTVYYWLFGICHFDWDHHCWNLERVCWHLCFCKQMENGSVSEKMDFKLKIPCSIFLIKTSISSEYFADLVLSQDLSAKAEITCEAVSLSWVMSIYYFFLIYSWILSLSQLAIFDLQSLFEYSTVWEFEAYCMELLVAVAFC